MLFYRKKKSLLSEVIEKYTDGEVSLRSCSLHLPPRLPQGRLREGHWVKNEAFSGLKEALAMNPPLGCPLCSPSTRRKLAGACSLNPLSLLLWWMWPRKPVTRHHVDMVQGQTARTNTGLLMQQHGSRVFIFLIARFAFCCVLPPRPPNITLILIFFVLNLSHKANLLNYGSERGLLLMIFFFVYFTSFNYSRLRNLTGIGAMMALCGAVVHFQGGRNVQSSFLVFTLIVFWEQKKY